MKQILLTIRQHMQLCAVLLALCMGVVSCEKNDDGGDDTSKSVSSGKIDGYEYVDLGLSVKWAKCNVGATAPLASGNYFQYGNPDAFNFKSYFSEVPDYGIGGNSQYDPATVNMSKKWRMPTYQEFYELVKECDWQMITTAGGSRYVLVTGSNGNTLQLPLAGFYPSDAKSLLYENYQCCLLSSTLNNGGNPVPYALLVRYTNETREPDVNITTNELNRLARVPIRAVSDY